MELCHICPSVICLFYRAYHSSRLAREFGSDGKESAGNAGDPHSLPGSGRSPGGGHGNPFQYSCLENPVDRGAWWATIHRVAQSDITEVT